MSTETQERSLNIAYDAQDFDRVLAADSHQVCGVVDLARGEDEDSGVVVVIDIHETTRCVEMLSAPEEEQQKQSRRTWTWPRTNLLIPGCFSLYLSPRSPLSTLLSTTEKRPTQHRFSLGSRTIPSFHQSTPRRIDHHARDCR